MVVCRMSADAAPAGAWTPGPGYDVRIRGPVRSAASRSRSRRRRRTHREPFGARAPSDDAGGPPVRGRARPPPGGGARVAIRNCRVDAAPFALRIGSSSKISPQPMSSSSSSSSTPLVFTSGGHRCESRIVYHIFGNEHGCRLRKTSVRTNFLWERSTVRSLPLRSLCAA